MAVVIGVVEKNGDVIILPDKSYPLTTDTSIIVVAEDDDRYCAETYASKVEFAIEIWLPQG